uniref:Uncharacterized protein n=1 Tax=Peronospora matthiolae TaxID=2874970 RepID=A0AAV1UEU3_9STRA
MVNKQKSTCQLRLEARSRACCAPPGASFDTQQRADELQSRIARANEIRALHTRQLAARARAQVQHAREVAKEMRAKRHEETRRFRQLSVLKLDEAARRRDDQLLQLQLQCKQRAHWITEKLELVRADQSDRADRARRTLAAQLSEAARRRHEQTQRRVGRLHKRWQSVTSVKDRVARAKFIQRWVRRHVANCDTAMALQNVQPDVETVVACWRFMERATFDACMRRLQQRGVGQAAQRLLTVLLATVPDCRKRVAAVQKPAAICDGGPFLAVPPKGHVTFRVLLMAGLLASHSSEVMDRTLSQRLYYAARTIVLNMKQLALCLAASEGRQQTQALTRSVSALTARFAFYTEAFARWKERDAECLAAELLTSSRELMAVHRKYELKQALEAQGAGDGVHELVRQTRGQLHQMQSALEKVVGRTEAKRRLDELKQSLTRDSGGERADRDGVLVDAEAWERSAGGAGDAVVAASGDSSTKGDEDDGGDDGGAVGVCSALLGDRRLVHELILNPQVQIPRDCEVELAAAFPVSSEHSAATVAVRVRDAMTRAFWDRVVAADDVEVLLARTEELRSAFRSALESRSRTELEGLRAALAGEIDSALDPEHLRVLMQDPMRNVIAIQARCHAVLDAIERAEAPARAASTREFRADWAQRVAAGAMTPIALLVAFLTFTMDKVEELRSDMLNAHLGLLGAFLQRHGVDYEKKALESQLSEAGSLDAKFSSTIKWLALELETYLGRSDVDEAERARLVRHNGEAYKRFLRASIWALVEKYIEDTSSSAWPETFELDVARIRACRDALDRIAVISSFLTIVKEHVARRHLSTPVGFLEHVGQQLGTLLCSSGVSGAQLAAQATENVRQLESLGNEETKRELHALEKRLLGCFAADNAVFQLFFSRASRAFELSLQKDHVAHAVHPSLAPFAADISEATSALRRLVEHNEKVYASLYNTIIKRLLSPSVQPRSEAAN